SAIWHKVRAAKGPTQGKLRGLIQRYFWCSVFMRNYDQGGNSQAGRDFIDLEQWFAGKEAPEAVRDFSFGEDLAAAKTNLKALFRGIMALSLRKRAKDFHKCDTITPTRMAELEIDAHHLFPSGWFEDTKTKGEPGLIINRALIDKETNQRIGKSAPSKYLADVVAVLGADQLRAVLDSHL